MVDAELKRLLDKLAEGLADCRRILRGEKIEDTN